MKTRKLTVALTSFRILYIIKLTFFYTEELAINQELSDNFVVDLRNCMPIGSIINFGLYQIPPQPKKIKQWVITQGGKSNDALLLCLKVMIHFLNLNLFYF